MKLFITALALCLIATSYCASKKPGEECTSADTCTGDSDCEKDEASSFIFCDVMKCLCKGDNKEIKADKCQNKPTAKLGEACTKKEECIGSNMECTEKKCKCPTGKPGYDENLKICVDKVLLDGTCAKTEDCDTNLECKDTKCACKAMYAKENDADQKCSKKTGATLDATCAKKEDCEGTSLECTEKKCKCPSGKPGYIKKTMTCIAKVVLDGTCAKDDDCDTNLKCTSKKCACKPGYDKENDDDQQCSKKNYAKLDEDCSSKPCDDVSTSNLECKEKKCICKTDYSAKEISEIMGKDVKTVKKCLPKQATFEIKSNKTCSFSPENKSSDKYCEKGLVCTKCPITTGAEICWKKPDVTGGVGQLTFSMSVVLGCYALKKIFM